MSEVAPKIDLRKISELAEEASEMLEQQIAMLTSEKLSDAQLSEYSFRQQQIRVLISAMNVDRN